MHTRSFALKPNSNHREQQFTCSSRVSPVLAVAAPAAPHQSEAAVQAPLLPSYVQLWNAQPYQQQTHLEKLQFLASSPMMEQHGKQHMQPGSATSQHPQQQQQQRVWRPRWQLHKLRSISGVCRVLQQQQSELMPSLWVRGFSQVVLLVGQGQQVPAEGWRVLRDSLVFLATPPAPAGAAAATGPAAAGDWVQAASATAREAAAAAPICSFTAYQLATLLWAAGKLKLQVPEAAWPVILANACSVSSSMTPRDASLTVWAFSRLKPPVPVGQPVLQLLEGSSQPLQAYPAKSLSLVLYSLVRLKLQLPPTWQQQLLEAAAAHLHTSSSSSRTVNVAPTSSSSSSSKGRSKQWFSGRDLALLVWCLQGLDLTPPAHFLTAVLCASKPHLSSLSCVELTALLVGVGRLQFVPPGPWLLEAYDQLYWTVDQLSLSELCGVLWALGRLRLVAVPPELLERLLTFVNVRLQEQQQQPQEPLLALPQTKKQQQQQVASAAASKLQFTLSKQLSLLLTGLAGLSRQLSPQQQQQCRTWLLQVLQASSSTAQAGLQVASSLHAASRLEVRVSSPADRAQIFSAVPALKGRLKLSSVALAVWGAVGVAGPPGQQQLQQWLQNTLPALPHSSVGELHMLLHACVLAGHQPSREWWAAAAQRLQQLVPTMAGRNCVFLSQLLLDLVLQQQQQQQQQRQRQQQQPPRKLQHAAWPTTGAVADPCSSTDAAAAAAAAWVSPGNVADMFRQQLQDQAQQLSELLPAPHAAASAAAGAVHVAGLLEAGLDSRTSYVAAAAEHDDPAAAAAAVPGVCIASVEQLLQLLSARVEALEMLQYISSKSLENFERNRRLLTTLLAVPAAEQ